MPTATNSATIEVARTKADLARSMAFLQALSLFRQGAFTLPQTVVYLREEYKKQLGWS